MKKGDLVYEIIDGGWVPARVLCEIEATNQVVVRLEPNANAKRQSRPGEREDYLHKGYIVFRRENLAPWSPSVVGL